MNAVNIFSVSFYFLDRVKYLGKTTLSENYHLSMVAALPLHVMVPFLRQ